MAPKKTTKGKKSNNLSNNSVSSDTNTVEVEIHEPPLRSTRISRTRNPTVNNSSCSLTNLTMRPPGIETKLPRNPPFTKNTNRSNLNEKSSIASDDQSEMNRRNETNDNDPDEVRVDEEQANETENQSTTMNLGGFDGKGQNPWQDIVKVMVAAQLETFKSLNLYGLGNSTITVNSEGSFQLPAFPEKSKLDNRKNYKSWKRILDMNLESLEFHSYIYVNDEPSPEIEEKIRKTRARARTYVFSSLTSNVQSAVSHTKTVFEMLSLINEKYGENETLDCADLIDRLDRITFKLGYDQQRYINNFNSLMADWDEAGMIISDQVKRLYFLKRIEGTNVGGTPLALYFDSMSLQSKENRTLQFVQDQFRNLNLQRFANQLKNVERKDQRAETSNNRPNEKNNRKRFNDHSADYRPAKRQNFERSDRKNFERSDRQYSQRFDRNNVRNYYDYDRNKRTVENFSKPFENTSKIDSGDHKQGETYYFRNVKVVQSCKPVYTSEQSEKIRNWTREEKRKNTCLNCDDYFHTSRICKNPGKRCHRCKNFAHIGVECPFFSERKQ